MIAEAKIVNFYKNSLKKFADKKILPTFALAITKCVVDGAIAQLVEQRTENPCVPGSNPGGTTRAEDANEATQSSGFCFFVCTVSCSHETVYTKEQCSRYGFICILCQGRTRERQA